jgi:hypothetical protein
MTLPATGKFIKSLQAVSVEFGTGDTQKDSAAFTAVTMANTIILFAGRETADVSMATQAYNEHFFAKWNLQSTTTIRANRKTSGTYTMKMRFFVVEFMPVAIKMLEHVSDSITGATYTKTSTLSTSIVTEANAVIIANGAYGSNLTPVWGQQIVRHDISSGDVVTTRASNSNNTTLFEFTVVEFQPAILNQ